MILPKFLWDYGHSTIQIWRRYNKFKSGERGSLPVDVRLTSGWRASLKNASQPRSQGPLLLTPGEKEEPGNEIVQARYHKRPFSHDVTAAIFAYKTMNRRTCLCTKKNDVEIELFSHVKTFLSFQAIDHATWLKTIYWPATFQTAHFIGPYNLHYLLLSGIGALLCHYPYCFPSQSQIWFGIDAGPPHYQPVEKACSRERVCIV